MSPTLRNEVSTGILRRIYTATMARSSRNVLLVENNLDDARLVQKALKKQDYEVEVARTGQEALDKMNKSYACICIGLNLPDMDGHEIVEQATALGFPTVVITRVEVDPAYADVLLRLGASNILDKNKVAEFVGSNGAA